MFEKIKENNRRIREEKLRYDINRSFSVTEKKGHLYITHCGEAICDVTGTTTQDILDRLSRMREDCFEWNRNIIK